ncbi:MAG: hypothetical protein JW862_12595 [Anaerolineales bacterium]|nr:hypothetical protein [Anaerolineales bacterium]
MNKYKHIFILTVCSLCFLVACSVSVPSFGIRSQEQTFPVQDLLISVESLPRDWILRSGPGKIIDSDRSFDTAAIDFTHETRPDERPILQLVFRYETIQESKNDFDDASRFSSNFELENWNFRSEKADETKLSCYKYSNKEYPICTWLARYDEIMVEVIIHLDPDILSVSEMESIIRAVDQKVVNILWPAPQN